MTTEETDLAIDWLMLLLSMIFVEYGEVWEELENSSDLLLMMVDKLDLLMLIGDEWNFVRSEWAEVDVMERLQVYEAVGGLDC